MDKLNEEVKWKRWQIGLVILSLLGALFINTVVATSYIKDVENRTMSNEKTLIEHGTSIKELQGESKDTYKAVKTMELNLKLFMQQQGYKYED